MNRKIFQSFGVSGDSIPWSAAPVTALYQTQRPRMQTDNAPFSCSPVHTETSETSKHFSAVAVLTKLSLLSLSVLC